MTAADLLSNLTEHQTLLWTHFQAAVQILAATRKDADATRARLTQAEEDLSQLTATLAEAESDLHHAIEIGSTADEARLDKVIDAIRGRIHKAKQRRGILAASLAKKETDLPRFAQRIVGEKHALLHSLMCSRADEIRGQLEPIWREFDVLAQAGGAPVFNPAAAPWSLWASQRHLPEVQAAGDTLAAELERLAASPATE